MPCCFINGSCTSGKIIGGILLATSIVAAVGMTRTTSEPETSAPTAAAAGPKPDTKPEAKAPKSMHDFTVKSIDGKDVNLADYKGKVCLVVNVASKCGYTKQYEGLEKLYKAKKDSGLTILGFPCNDFGNQEPGTEAEIKDFCTSKFSVTFPMFAKLAVKGDTTAPLYKWIIAQENSGKTPPKWNFTKFLIDQNGQVIARYDSNITPDDAKLTAKIDELLAKNASAEAAPKK
jgi:glutathione peroxidase